jgi:hypothetical protein
MEGGDGRIRGEARLDWMTGDGSGLALEGARGASSSRTVVGISHSRAAGQAEQVAEGRTAASMRGRRTALLFMSLAAFLLEAQREPAYLQPPASNHERQVAAQAGQLCTDNPAFSLSSSSPAHGPMGNRCRWSRVRTQCDMGSRRPPLRVGPSGQTPTTITHFIRAGLIWRPWRAIFGPR